MNKPKEIVVLQDGPCDGKKVEVFSDTNKYIIPGFNEGEYVREETGLFVWSQIPAPDGEEKKPDPTCDDEYDLSKRTYPADYDYVVQPDHYNKGKDVETIEIMDKLPTHLDNAFKYLDRLDGKPGETLKRNAESARWYLLRYALVQRWITKEQWEIAVGRKKGEEKSNIIYMCPNDRCRARLLHKGGNLWDCPSCGNKYAFMNRE